MASFGDGFPLGTAKVYDCTTTDTINDDLAEAHINALIQDIVRNGNEGSASRSRCGTPHRPR